MKKKKEIVGLKKRARKKEVKRSKMAEVQMSEGAIPFAPLNLFFSIVS